MRPLKKLHKPAKLWGQGQADFLCFPLFRDQFRGGKISELKWKDESRNLHLWRREHNDGDSQGH